MSNSLWLRILKYAVTHSNDPKWKKRKFALIYGASLVQLSRIKN